MAVSCGQSTPSHETQLKNSEVMNSQVSPAEWTCKFEEFSPSQPDRPTNSEEIVLLADKKVVKSAYLRQASAYIERIENFKNTGKEEALLVQIDHSDGTSAFTDYPVSLGYAHTALKTKSGEKFYLSCHKR
jgi:hypothetical protein